MRIAITGGSGNVARHVAMELKDYDITAFDTRECELPGVASQPLDILDLAACSKAFEGVDVVVHLAAIPVPIEDNPDKVLHTNVVGTYCVFEAARRARVKRVVQASSDSTLGFVFRERPLRPKYLPLDEKHPLRPQDAYGLSKQCCELVAESFVRRCGLQAVSLRFSKAVFPGNVDELEALILDPAHMANGLWAYTDVRDVARAFRLAIEAEDLANEAFFISAADSLTDRNILDLVSQHYGEGIEIRKPLPGNSSLIDCSRAKEVLGYQPQFSWRDILKSN